MDLTKISDKQGFKNSLGRYVGRLGSLFAGKAPIVIKKKEQIIAKVDKLIERLSSEINVSEFKSELKHQDESGKSPTGSSTALSLQIEALFPKLEEIDCTYSEETMEEVKQSLDFLTVNKLEEEKKAQCVALYCEKDVQYVVSCPSCKWEKNYCENCLKGLVKTLTPKCAKILDHYSCHTDMRLEDVVKLGGKPVSNFFLRRGVRKRLVDMGLMYKECSDADCPGALIQNVHFYKNYCYKCSCGKTYHVDGLKALEEAITKQGFPCPGCHTPTYRSKDCMHMVCNQCSSGWCWTCLFHIVGLIERDSFSNPLGKMKRLDERLKVNRDYDGHNRAYHQGTTFYQCALKKETCPCKD